MGVIEDTVVKAKEVLDITGKKAGEVFAIQKLKVNAASVSSQIAKDYEAMGRLVYDGIKNGHKNDSAIGAIVKEIDEKHEQLKEIEVKIAEVKGNSICGKCGSANSVDATYCHKCGCKLFEDCECDDNNNCDDNCNNKDNCDA